MPEQLRLLAEGLLDVGFGRAVLAPPAVASELFRLDPAGVLLPAAHPLASRASVPVSALRGEPLLLSPEARAPEFNQFVLELCRSTGFTPTLYPGTVGSIRASADLVAQGRCLTCVPASCARRLSGELGWVGEADERPQARPARHLGGQLGKRRAS